MKKYCSRCKNLIRRRCLTLTSKRHRISKNQKMITEENYKRLCDKVKAIRCYGDSLTNIKNDFRDQINSVRRYEHINNMPQLIQVLQKRDYLNMYNIEPIRQIATKLNRSDILQLISDIREIQPVSRPCYNTSVLPEVPTTMIDRVHFTICREIGASWRFFARALGITEGYISSLECEPKSTNDKVLEILHYYRATCDKRKWRSGLLEALRTARRNDLRISVEEIIDTLS